MGHRESHEEFRSGREAAKPRAAPQSMGAEYFTGVRESLLKSHSSGVFFLIVVSCIFSKSGSKHEQTIHASIHPSQKGGSLESQQNTCAFNSISTSQGTSVLEKSLGGCFPWIWLTPSPSHILWLGKSKSELSHVGMYLVRSICDLA